MNKFLFIFSLALLSCFILSCQNQQAPTEPEAMEPSEPVTYPGVPQVVVVSGTNFDMGVQYGPQAAQSIEEKLDEALSA